MNPADALAPLCLPPNPPPRHVRNMLPVGSTDCHCHVYEDLERYARNPNRSYTPVQATRHEYLAMCAALGITRTIQVSASVYGFDNSLTLDVIAELGQDRARGVAGVAPDTSRAELGKLHDGGIRGVRLSTSLKGYGGTEAIEALAPHIQPLGWHAQVHVKQSAELAQLEPALLRARVPLVFDHLGCVRGGEGVGSAGFQTLLRLLRQRDDCWVKLSSWYRRSDAGGPDYADMRVLVQALVDARPDRLVFGTNWPHPRLFEAGRVPDDGALTDLFCEWVPDLAVRHRILVDNPALLYGFGA
jgi:2-pyrone-4,6-dicarboxylate lactonase